MTYDNTNRGALFLNEDRQTDKHPQYKGSINAGGVEYWASLWHNEAKSGKKYLSISLTPKDKDLGEEGENDPDAQSATPLLDSEIPF